MKYLVLTCILVFNVIVCYGQSLNDLQKKRENTAKEIQYTSRLLSEAKKSEKSSLNKLHLIKNRIGQRNTIISGIKNEIALYDEVIHDNEALIQWFQEDLDTIRKEYASLIRAAYKNKFSNDIVLFLLASESFNQAHKRMLFLRHYTAYRKKQATAIKAIQDILQDKKNRLEIQKEARQGLINQTQKEKINLAKEVDQQNKELYKLQNQKQKLLEKLNRQKREEQELEREIERIIEEEARKNMADDGSVFALTPEQKLTGNSFEQNKEKLPWPVERGIVTGKFGIHQHPVLENVQIRNNGIDIATEIGAKVRAVFKGEVTRVFGISGGNTAVIIRHGKYLSVYSNLREVVVKQGQKVSTKQTIGTVFTDFDDANKTILKFQIWKENQKMNPEKWIGF